MCSPAAARVSRRIKRSIASESVWNDGASGGATGGGISSFFALPAWQKGLSALTTQGATVALSMRGVPDVSGDADPETGYDVRVDGTDTVIGGTSAVAPLWAALIARINASTGKPAGFVNPLLYHNAQALPRHHPGQQRRFRRPAGLGCLHGPRQPERQRCSHGSCDAGACAPGRRPSAGAGTGREGR